MLLRHPWLDELMKPPTISEDAEAEAEAEAAAAGIVAAVPNPTPPVPPEAATESITHALETLQVSSGAPGFVDTADSEVGDWVKAALEKKRLGKVKGAAKPALHAAPLDAVPSPNPEAKTVLA